MHLAFVFPGGGYRPDHPLLYFARRALENVGAAEVLVTYERFDALEELQDLSHPFFEAVRRDVERGLAAERPSRVTLVGSRSGASLLPSSSGPAWFPTLPRCG